MKNRIMLLLFSLICMPVSAEPLKVFASVLPISSLVAQVGGERVQVEALVTAGHDPVTYDPHPSQLQRLGKADLYFTSGLPFESVWMKRIQSLNPQMQIIDLRHDLPIEGGDDHSHDGHDHHGPDPHVWTSPANIIAMLAIIESTLVTHDAQGAGLYRNNRLAAAEAYEQLDSHAAQVTGALTQRHFLVFHPAWGYFANQYGLEQLVIEESGKEPGPKRLGELIDLAKEHAITRIYVQPQFDQRIATVVAEAIGAQLVILDPLSDDLEKSLNLFIENLQTTQ